MRYPLPQEIRVHPERDALTLIYDSGEHTLPAEYLRVLSPSAEVRGHGIGHEKLQTGKRGVRIEEIAASGNYALKIYFSDGHDSGLYDWDYLYLLAHEYETRWQDYLHKLAAAGATRDAEPQKQPAPAQHGCGGCGKHH